MLPKIGNLHFIGDMTQIDSPLQNFPEYKRIS